MKNIHLEPGAYSQLERAAELQNMIVKELGLPVEWLVEIPFKAGHCCDEAFLGANHLYTNTHPVMLGYFLGLAIASGTITQSKCREWLSLENFTKAHEVANIGMAVRDGIHKDYQND